MTRVPCFRSTALVLGVSAALVTCDAPGSGSPQPQANTEVGGGMVPLPLSIQGLLRVETLQGPQAARMLGKMHGGDVAPESSFVGRYRGEGGHATLYVSRFDTPGAADSILAEMSESIGVGNSEFAHHARFEAGDRPIHMVLGQGQVHFFLTRNEELLWLGIDGPLARTGLAEVLGLRAQDLPDRIAVGGLRPPQEGVPGAADSTRVDSLGESSR